MEGGFHCGGCGICPRAGAGGGPSSIRGTGAGCVAPALHRRRSTAATGTLGLWDLASIPPCHSCIITHDHGAAEPSPFGGYYDARDDQPHAFDLSNSFLLAARCGRICHACPSRLDIAGAVLALQLLYMLLMFRFAGPQPISPAVLLRAPYCLAVIAGAQALALFGFNRGAWSRTVR